MLKTKIGYVRSISVALIVTCLTMSFSVEAGRFGGGGSSKGGGFSFGGGSSSKGSGFSFGGGSSKGNSSGTKSNTPKYDSTTSFGGSKPTGSDKYGSYGSDKYGSAETAKYNSIGTNNYGRSVAGTAIVGGAVAYGASANASEAEKKTEDTEKKTVRNFGSDSGADKATSSDKTGVAYNSNIEKQYAKQTTAETAAAFKQTPPTAPAGSDKVGKSAISAAPAVGAGYGYGYGTEAGTGAYASNTSGKTADAEKKTVQNFGFGSSNTASSDKFGKTYNSNIEKKYAEQAAAQASADFKKTMPQATPPYIPTADLKNYRDRYSNNPIFNTVRNDNDAWGSRNRYYQSHPAPIVYKSSSSFGSMAGPFLYGMLTDHVLAALFAEKHRDDPNYLAWRTEADRLARDNAELRSQLTRMDAAKSQLHDVQTDNNWLPDGVPAAAALSVEALKASQPDFNGCVGSESGPYYMVTQTKMMPAVSDMINLNVIATKGTPEILAKAASGACDGGYIQGDTNYDKSQLEVVFKPFLEAAHLACSVNIKGDSIDDIADRTVWIPAGSGSRITWDHFVSLNPKLGNIEVEDAVNYEDAILKSTQTQACLFYMAAPHASEIDRLIDRKDLKLMAINDKSLLKDGAYQPRYLSSGDYNRTIPSGFLSSGRVDTVVAPAMFFMTKTWKSAHPELAAKISLKLADIENELKKSVKQ